MTTIDAAIVREQGVEFTVVSVRSSAASSQTESARVIDGLTSYFPGRPIILMARVGSRIKFIGERTDIVRWLANVPVNALPWKQYRFSS